MASGPLASPLPADWLRRGQDLILPIAIIASVLVILVPLPPALMDVLLSGNIAISVLVLLTTIYVRTPLEFSIFPTVLLATTLARLVRKKRLPPEGSSRRSRISSPARAKSSSA
jgi:flagellar biosynthesis protein FlhA